MLQGKVKLFNFLQQFFALPDIVAVNVAGMIHAAILSRAGNATKQQKLHCKHEKKVQRVPTALINETIFTMQIRVHSCFDAYAEILQIKHFFENENKN
mgnify:CR=1 FL=1